ncbi:MAG: hypothetical protein ACR2QW_09760, partial [bacterium]
MLNQEYSYYLLKTFLAGLPTIPGVLGLLTLVICMALLLKLFNPERRTLFLWTGLTLSVALLTIAFYSAVFEFDENPDSLSVYNPADNEGECGTIWTNWIRGGYGIGSRCPKGCYR